MRRTSRFVKHTKNELIEENSIRQLTVTILQSIFLRNALATVRTKQTAKHKIQSCLQTSDRPEGLSQ